MYVLTDMLLSKQVQVLRAGEMAALIAVPDRRRRLRQGLFDGDEHEAQLQGLVELPTHHIARVPVQDGHQVHPAAAQSDVGDVDVDRAT